MGKLLCDSTTIQPSPQALPWKPPTTPPLDPIDIKTTWETVTGLEDQQKRYLQKLHSKGVLWKHPVRDSSPTRSTTIFRLSHGGDVDADGNCLFTASRKAMGLEMGARDLRKRTVSRFMADLESESSLERESNDAAIKHLYSPDLKVGWGIHVVQEVKLLAKKADRESLDVAIQDLLEVGLQRFFAIAVMDLLKNVTVQAIIGPQKSEQTEFTVDVGHKLRIPIISFSATSPSIYSRSPYFIRTTPDDHTQVKAIASIAEAFKWRKAILVHEDSDYGNRLVPHLIGCPRRLFIVPL